MQLTASDHCWFQHHILTLFKHFTNQFNEYTTLTFYWVALQRNSITQRQPFLLFGGNSDLVDAINVKRALYKDYCNQFTIHLQICHHNIMWYVMATKYFWKQNRCYTSLFLHALPTLIYPVAFLNYTYACRVRAEHFFYSTFMLCQSKKGFYQS